VATIRRRRGHYASERGSRPVARWKRRHRLARNVEHTPTRAQRPSHLVTERVHCHPLAGLSLARVERVGVIVQKRSLVHAWATLPDRWRQAMHGRTLAVVDAGCLHGGLRIQGLVWVHSPERVSKVGVGGRVHPLPENSRGRNARGRRHSVKWVGLRRRRGHRRADRLAT
jgi:hypothetical protein